MCMKFEKIGCCLALFDAQKIQNGPMDSVASKQAHKILLSHFSVEICVVLFYDKAIDKEGSNLHLWTSPHLVSQCCLAL